MGRLLLVTAIVVSFAACGCGERTTYHVSGKVVYNNQPVPVGEIFFDPDVSKDNRGPQGHATITNGEYSTANGGRGIVGGPFKVRILGFDGKEGEEMPAGSPLFPEYTESVDFPKETTTKDFSVPRNPGASVPPGS